MATNNTQFISIDEARAITNKASKIFDKLREIEVEAKIREVAARGESRVVIPMSTHDEAGALSDFLDNLGWNTEVETNGEGFVSLVVSW